MEPFLGMIAIFGFNFNPDGWAFCSGQLLNIAQNQALFSLLGTTYGGKGVTTFALPDLRSRVPVGMGQGPGLSNYALGMTTGVETSVLLNNNLPSHTHTITATTEPGDTTAPEGAFLAYSGIIDKEYKLAPATKVVMNTTMAGQTGNNVPFSIMQPFLAMNYCIALEGIFPPRP